MRFHWRKKNNQSHAKLKFFSFLFSFYIKCILLSAAKNPLNVTYRLDAHFNTLFLCIYSLLHSPAKNSLKSACYIHTHTYLVATYPLLYVTSLSFSNTPFTYSLASDHPKKKNLIKLLLLALEPRSHPRHASHP